MATSVSYSLEDIRSILAAAGASEEMIAAAEEKASTVAVESAARETLSAKCVEGLDLDAVAASFFGFAETVSESVNVTPGDPKGGNKNTRADRHMIEIATPSGRMQVHLYVD